MDEQSCPLDVAEKLNAEAGAGVRAFNQAWDVGHNETAEVRQLHDAEIRFQRGEWVVGDLRSRGRYAGDQRAFAGIRESDEAGVCEEFEFEPQPLLFAGTA